MRRDNVELTADFTASVNAELRVGAIEETITVAAESPIVDVQSITTRTVMTRDVLDAIPTGRNIQAVGIMIPGTSARGRRRRRAVARRRRLGQPPAVAAAVSRLRRHGADDRRHPPEQPLRTGRLQRRVLERRQLPGNQLRDRRRLRGNGAGRHPRQHGAEGRRQHVPRIDRGNGTTENWIADNLGDNLAGDLTYNPNNRLVNVGKIQKIWDVNPTIGGPIWRDKLWFNFTYRHWGSEKTVADSFYDLDPSNRYVAGPVAARRRRRPHREPRRAHRLADQREGQAHGLSRRSEQVPRSLGHLGDVPPETSAIQVTPTSFVNVTRWTRTHTNRLLFDVGFGIYDQEYTELYQPGVLNGFSDKVWNSDAIRASQVYTLFDNGTCKRQGAWNNPADHFSLLRTYSGSMSYVTGSHSFKVGTAVSEGNWRLLEEFTGDVSTITFTNGNPSTTTLRLPTDRRNHIKADIGIYAQDRWTMGRATLNLGLRYDWFLGETGEGEVLPSRYNGGITFGKCAGRQQRPGGRMRRQGPGLEGHLAARRRRLRPVRRRADGYQGERGALRGGPADRHRQRQQPGDGARPDRRAAVDRRDGNGLPFDANGNLQMNELGTVHRDTDLRSERVDDAVRPGDAERLVQARLQLGDSVALQHLLFGRDVGRGRLLPPDLRQPDVRRRPALRTRAITTGRSASTLRPMRICRTAAATRCAACTT